MARNVTTELSTTDALRVEGFEQMLAPQVGGYVAITYTKRDGTPANLSGILVDIIGATPDKRVARVETLKGMRSANLVNISWV